MINKWNRLNSLGISSYVSLAYQTIYMQNTRRIPVQNCASRDLALPACKCNVT